MDNNQHISSRHRNYHDTEDFILIWISYNIDDSNDYIKKCIAILQDIVHSIEFFTDLDQCVNFIAKTTDKKISIIISKEYIQQLMRLIQEANQLNSVYLLSDDTLGHEECIKQYKKVKGVYNHITAIYDALKHDIHLCNSSLTPISIIPPSVPANPGELDPSFMYSQLLNEIFLDTKYNEKEKKEFVNYWRIKSRRNDVTMKIIDEFEETYNEQSTIWWYTRDCFIYETLNSAMRTQEIDVILKMGFFLRDLHCQIQRLHSKANNLNRLIVFRGQCILNTELEKIKNSKGGLLSFNNFLSTSINYQVAFTFADSVLQNVNSTGIIFQIEIDPLSLPTPFASIGEISFFKDVEEEILFSMNSVFRIGETKQTEDRLWLTNLTLTSDNDQLLVDLTKYMRQKIKGPTPLHRMGQLMIQMSRYDKAEEIIHALLKTVPDDDEQIRDERDS